MELKMETRYRKSLTEAYRSILESRNMDLMRKAAKGQHQNIKFKDGTLKMDSFTASEIMGVYNKVNPKNKASMEKMINDGTKSQILKLQSLAMKASGRSGRREETVAERLHKDSYELGTDEYNEYLKNLQFTRPQQQQPFRRPLQVRPPFVDDLRNLKIR